MGLFFVFPKKKMGLAKISLQTTLLLSRVKGKETKFELSLRQWVEDQPATIEGSIFPQPRFGDTNVDALAYIWIQAAGWGRPYGPLNVPLPLPLLRAQLSFSVIQHLKTGNQDGAVTTGCPLSICMGEHYTLEF